MYKKNLGNKGEQIASAYLEKIGYKILDKNFRKRTGEIDLIALDTEFDEIVFIEVKTRRGDSYGYPEESVSENKIEKITETANIWLEEKEKDDKSWRIDIIAIELVAEKPKIEHIKNI